MSGWLESAKANGLFLRLGLGVAALVVIVDQLTKHLVVYALRLPQRLGGHIELSPVVDFTYVENRGVSFGLFAGGLASRILLSLLAIGIAAYVIRWMGTLHRRVAMIGGGLIVGGALGNLYDRVLYGYVVDFIDARDVLFPFQFNIADAAINAGVACLIWDAIFDAPKAQKPADERAET